jgi:hypothetical protein
MLKRTQITYILHWDISIVSGIVGSEPSNNVDCGLLLQSFLHPEVDVVQNLSFENYLFSFFVVCKISEEPHCVLESILAFDLGNEHFSERDHLVLGVQQILDCFIVVSTR